MKNRRLKKELLENGTFKQYSNEKFNIYKNGQAHRLTKFQQEEEDKEYIEYNKNHKEYARNTKKYEVIAIKVKRATGEDLLLNTNYRESDKWNYYLLLKQKLQNFNLEKYIACKQMENCRYMQRAEIKRHIKYWLENNYIIIFNTYTLTNETLMKFGELGVDGIYNNTKKLQDKLTRILQQYTDDYIGNVDYGKKKDRLHYHVLEAYKNKIIKKDIEERIRNETDITWEKYGFTYPEFINTEIKDQNKLANYVSKLTNHAIKVKANRLFIKKDTPYKELNKIQNYHTSGVIKKETEEHIQKYNNLLEIST